MASTPSVRRLPTDWLDLALPLAARDRRRSSGSARRSTSSRSTTTCGRRRRSGTRERGVGGEAWEIHGGGFYRVEKFQVAPRALPEPLHWFKWEAYTTWLSRLRAAWSSSTTCNAHTFLIDTSVADLSTREAIAIAIGLLAVAWLVYDAALPRCSAARAARLALVLLALVALTAWGVGQLFAPRAAYLQVGAMLGTIMVGERLLRDHPGPLGARAREGGGPRARPGRERARQAALGAQQLPHAARCCSRCSRTTSRSRTATRYAWLILVVLMVIGALDPALLQPAPRGRDALVDPGHGRGRASRRSRS